MNRHMQLRILTGLFSVFLGQLCVSLAEAEATGDPVELLENNGRGLSETRDVLIDTVLDILIEKFDSGKQVESISAMHSLIAYCKKQATPISFRTVDAIYYTLACFYQDNENSSQALEVLRGRSSLLSLRPTGDFDYNGVLCTAEGSDYERDKALVVALSDESIFTFVNLGYGESSKVLERLRSLETNLLKPAIAEAHWVALFNLSRARNWKDTLEVGSLMVAQGYVDQLSSAKKASFMEIYDQARQQR